MIDIILLNCYPYVIPTIHVVINHRLLFSCNLYIGFVGVQFFPFTI